MATKNTTKTNYTVTVDGKVVGKRSSAAVYTHAAILTYNDGSYSSVGALGFSSTKEGAEKMCAADQNLRARINKRERREVYVMAHYAYSVVAVDQAAQ